MTRILPVEIQTDTVKIPLSVISGIFISVWVIFLCNLFLPLVISILVACGVLLVASYLLIPFQRGNNLFFSIPYAKFDYFLFGTLIVVVSLLLHQSLHFTGNNILQIGLNEWGDFDLHLPLIRSFAYGANMPPQLPFFPNANSAYHFLFDYFSGILTFAGLPLSYAYNIASIIAWSCLLFCLYKLMNLLFHGKRMIGLLTILFFLCNGTLEFVEGYSKLHAKNIGDFLQKVVGNSSYLSTGPFTSDHVSLIWNLNVYLNQRHLIFGFALGVIILLLFFLIYKNHVSKNYVYLLGVLIGLTPLWDIYIFISLLIITGILTLFSIRKQPTLLLMFPLAFLLALPQLLWLTHDVKSFVHINPGFLVHHPLTFQSIATYWVYNLGISIVTLPIGFFLASKEQRKWFLAFFCIFIVANLIQFNSEMFNNHKLFDFWLIVSNGFTAFVVSKLIGEKLSWRFIVVFPLIFLLIFSGLIDLFVLKNETFYAVSDFGQDQFMQWVLMSTPQSAIFLVPGYTSYDGIRLSGRKEYVPFPRFATEYGYNVDSRNKLIQTIYKADDEENALKLLEQNNISYVEIPQSSTTPFSINKTFFLMNFATVYKNTSFTIVSIPQTVGREGN